MQAEFLEIRPFIYQFKLIDVPFSLQDVLAEVSTPTIDNTRHKINQFKNFGPIVESLSAFFCSNEFQTQLINIVSQNKLFWDSYWKHNPVIFKNNLSPIFEGDLDAPGFFMGPHLDNREIVTVGMCHFIDGDDPLQSTTFYTSEDRSNPIRMPTGFGVGWACANLHNTWHSGRNDSNKNRFSIKFGSELLFR